MQQLRQEYIGSPIEIASSRNKSLAGLKGIIIDETKNTFKVRCGDKIKIILKQGCTFKIKNQMIEGNKILKRPENRIKMKNGKK